MKHLDLLALPPSVAFEKQAEQGVRHRCEKKTEEYLGMDLSRGRTPFSVPLSRSHPGKSSLAELQEDNRSVWLGHKRPCELAFCRAQLNSPVACPRS